MAKTARPTPTLNALLHDLRERLMAQSSHGNTPAEFMVELIDIIVSMAESGNQKP